MTGARIGKLGARKTMAIGKTLLPDDGLWCGFVHDSWNEWTLGRVTGAAPRRTCSRYRPLGFVRLDERRPTSARFPVLLGSL